METKKEYMAPKTEQIELEMKVTLLAGSPDAITDPSGEDWTDE